MPHAQMHDLFAGSRAALAGQDVAYIRVAVERGIESSAGWEGLTYSAPEGAVRIGDRVHVPLGRGDRRAPGIVIAVGGAELAAGLRASSIKPMIGRAAGGPRLAEGLVELARWMAAYYVCPLGMVLATMVPAAVKKGTGRRVREELDVTPGVARAAPLTPAAAAAWRAIQGLPPGALPLPAKALARMLSLKTVGPLNRLVDGGLLRRVRREHISATPWLLREEAAGARAELTGEQSRAVEGIGRTMGRFVPHLLRGVTGSGKTEVYLRAMEGVLERGGSALVLVPEISLTPQTASRFVSRFASAGVAVLHSALSSSQRNQQWSRAAAGEARVVVGARSAVFAPLERLGLIVVDEEHDSSYKQDQLPRYNARDVALKRGQVEGCPVVLGSATPSLESWHNASAGEGGAGGAGGARFALWELTERIGRARLPRVEIVDLAEERRAGGKPGMGVGSMREGPPAIGPTLGAALEGTLGEGGQAIILLNRRGFASYICCRDVRCGWVLNCDDCSAAMVLHRMSALRTGRLLRCHHCLAERLVPAACPACAGSVRALGMGTQRVEEELGARFGGLVLGETMLRVDSDSMRTARDYFETLGRFADGAVKVLVGTQMVAKGLDFPNVRLVGIVNADTALSIPDFRAGERTFQLISQVAGRAGRGEAPGRVIVQTMNPREPAIRLAAAHDYLAFARRELVLRRTAGLPPVARMARIVVRDGDAGKAEARAAGLATALRGLEVAGVRVEGPMECPMARIAGQWRFAVEIVAPRPGLLARVLGELRGRGMLKSDARTAVDVDPVALM